MNGSEGNNVADEGENDAPQKTLQTVPGWDIPPDETR